ncbi:hypothetical protein HYH03_014992 [Edaphochlamys debaryana]|uniref:P-loop containing nucleoside triphosphate hydrolase protein n=1 Tax=Edaphochlamys debaryana TaxID=47281 RepID=A0A835XK92_9CHLO|nr:hypothetical protein HYH03_014992 [Edaphochlamys debaryana]|eukprot:KAG2486287.1 hypothetical protein HYH03_014992 [Edaphochlamys debaryana]
MAAAPAAEPRLEVIGAGFGRTGTMSLCAALNQLGYRTHHMKEVFVHSSAQSGPWLLATRAKAAGRPAREALAAALEGYSAAVDWPAAAFYKELLEVNPEAKVVLTLRDFDSWYASARDTIYAIRGVGLSIRPPWFRRLPPAWGGGGGLTDLTHIFAMHQELWWGARGPGGFAGRFEDREFARQVYEAHIAEVRRVVPRGQLLEFSVKEGWGPLCAFLGKPVPEAEPFPHVNDTAEFRGHALAERMRAEERLWRGVVVAAGAAALAALAALARGTLHRSS